MSSIVNDFSKFYVMLLLSEGPKHGYEIMSQMEGRLGRRASPGQVYPFLSALRSEGMVAFVEEGTGRKKRKVYSFTAEGRRLCDRLFAQFTALVSSAIRPSIRVCSHCGCSVFRDAHVEEVGGRRLSFCCRYCAASYRKSTVGGG